MHITKYENMDQSLQGRYFMGSGLNGKVKDSS